jgi:hypothetical protein
MTRRDTLVDQTDLERNGERRRPDATVRVCPKCQAPKIEGECEC